MLDHSMIADDVDVVSLLAMSHQVLVAPLVSIHVAADSHTHNVCFLELDPLQSCHPVNELVHSNVNTHREGRILIG